MELPSRGFWATSLFALLLRPSGLSTVRFPPRLCENWMTRGVRVAVLPCAWILAWIGYKPGFGRASGARKVAVKHAEPSIEAHAGPFYPGIAAISPLIPTKATMRLML